MTADPKMLGGLGDNPFWNFRRQGGLIYGSNPWYGYFLELPIRKGLLREVSWLLCLGGLSRKTFTFKPIKVGKTLAMMKA